MAIADYQTLTLLVLEFAARGETSVKDSIVALADKLGLSQDERTELLPSGKQVGALGQDPPRPRRPFGNHTAGPLPGNPEGRRSAGPSARTGSTTSC